MSGPYPVDVVVISGRFFSGEIAVAASSFLSMMWLPITPLCINTLVRNDFLFAMRRFQNQGNNQFYIQPEDFAPKLTFPNSKALNNLFWIALDKPGMYLAESFSIINGKNPKKKIYGNINYINFIGSHVPNFPFTGENLQYRWFDMLYRALLPWKESIKNIQSAWS